MLVLLAVIAMALKDFLAVFLTVAEVHGRHWLAGGLDAAGDLVTLGLGVLASAAFIQHGLGSAVAVCAASATTSLFATAGATKLSAHIKAKP